MKKYHIITTIILMSLVNLAGGAMAKEDKAFALNVNPTTCAISVPEDYTLWPTLGTLTHAKVEGSAMNIHEYHVVYTQPETIEYYQKKRRFPDGAVLVKELLNAETMSMTTGPAVGHATTIKGYFVLVQDTPKAGSKAHRYGAMAGDGRSSMQMIVSTQFPRIIRSIAYPVMYRPKTWPRGMPKKTTNGFTHWGIPCFGKNKEKDFNR